MTVSRRTVLTGLGASTLLAACGGEGGSETGPSPTPVPSPSPTPTPAGGTTSILTLGTSVFLGADLVGPSFPERDRFMRANAPVRYFADRLQFLRDQGRGGAVTENNFAVGGSFDNEAPQQYAAAAGRPYDLVFLGLGMNSGSAYGVHGRGPNAAFTRRILVDLIRRITSDGAQPIVCNTIHPWPEKITPQDTQGALYEGVAWPPESATLFRETNLRFDQSSGDIVSLDNAFATGPGRHLTQGAQLRIVSGGGRNEGRTYDVAQRLSADRLRTGAGQIAQSGDFRVFAQHYAPDLEAVLEPPLSQQRQTRDWNRSGRPVEGLVHYHLWNSILRDICEETSTLLLDFEYRGFAWVEKYGWESVYVSTDAGARFETFNHPQIDAQRAVYGGLMRHAADLFHRGTLPTTFAVLRGPDI